MQNSRSDAKMQHWSMHHLPLLVAEACEDNGMPSLHPAPTHIDDARDLSAACHNFFVISELDLMPESAISTGMQAIAMRG